MPWATKSRFEFEAVPSRFGAASATPLPWTRTMAATRQCPGDQWERQLAEVRQLRQRDAARNLPGVLHQGHLVGTGDAPQPTVGTASATSALTVASRVRDRPTRMAERREPGQQRCEVDPARDGRGRRPPSPARNPPWPFAPVRSGSWPKKMLTEIPVRKPVMTECDTKRV